MALEHITVLDLTHMLSGPYGAMLLTDLGARTIKVEPPGNGEGTRRLLEHDPDYSRDGMGAYFLTLNRSKRSVCIDLKSEAGRAVFLDLVKHADVVFDNFSVGVPKRLGIDHETLAQVNPRIVTCSVTGFGETGPDTERPAFDQALGKALGNAGLQVGSPVRKAIHAALGERDETAEICADAKGNPEPDPKLTERLATLYRGEMGTLYRDPRIDAKELLRQQAVLSALEAAMDCCQDAADVLENIAVKHA